MNEGHRRVSGGTRRVSGSHGVIADRRVSGAHAGGVRLQHEGRAGRIAPDPTRSREEWFEIARHLSEETDWESALPARAFGASYRVQQVVKRGVDFVLALVGLIATLPLLALLAVLIKLDSPGDVFYAWCVVGQRGRRFTGYKLRTMCADADSRKAELLHLNEMQGSVFKMRNDPRVTRLGRVLRKLSLDELPQLWSVLIGDMSLVGPRPMFPHEFATCLPEQRLKLAVRPGITCLWQVSGRSDIRRLSDWVSLDMEYIRHWSLALDAKILLRTVLAVVLGRGAH